MKVTVYEVGPRDGLQALKQPVETSTKIKLIDALYNAGLKTLKKRVLLTQNCTTNG